jgi:hypothetical protein
MGCAHRGILDLMAHAVPNALRRWFVVHFVADVLAAVPLLVAPRAVLELLGWSSVDPLATRLVAAALFGIGIESWLGRRAGIDTFRAMLDLKVIWSGAAVVGVLWSQLEGGPPAGWGVLAIFLVFHTVWVRYRLALRRGVR